MKTLSHLRGKLTISLSLAVVLALLVAPLSLAAVWTDKPDYSPGEVVTISGDDSDGAGYLPGEPVQVAVSGPNGYTAACDAIADEAGAWSCQVTLRADEQAIGVYAYAATGQTSLVSQNGIFTDAAQTRLTSVGPSCGASGATITATAKLEWLAPPSTWNSLSGKTVAFTLGTSSGSGTTNSSGIATASLVVPASATQLVASFARDSDYQRTDNTITFAVGCTADTTPPVVNVSFPTTNGSNGWFNTSPVNGSVSATDSSNVTAINCTDSAGGLTQGALVGGGTSTASRTLTVSGEGTHNISCTATDGASSPNTGAATGSSNTASVKIDTVAPTLTLAFTPNTPDGNNNWWKTTGGVPFVWTCSDSTSDIDPSFDGGCPSPLSGTVTAQGTTNFSDQVGDMAGNLSVAINRDLILDNIAPTISGSASPAANGAGWNNTDVAVSFTCSDVLSGLDSCGPNQTLSAEGVGLSATGTAVDEAGNSASTTVSGINIDKTAPTASASASPGPNANGWNNTNVTVSFSGSDGGSGIDSCSAPVTLSSEGAGQSASGTCTDKAGNESAPAEASDINIDKTAPIFGACPAGGPFLLSSGFQSVGPISVNAAISGLDAGLSALSGSVDTSSVGTKSVTFTAWDNAENDATKSCNYSVIYNWNGFFRPVDNLPTLNLVKAGQAIPVKFSLNGNMGLGIFAEGYPKSGVIACGTTAPVDSIEETVTAGNSSLSYDASADQYNYVWKTDKAWSGCRQLVVKLNDGMEYRANFKFTK